MLVLGMETSCDETGVAIVEDGNRVLAEAVASQEHIHAPYSGVVPELASRQHIRALGPLLQKCLKESGCGLGRINLIAVTRGPGLAGCLLSGLSFAKGLAYGLAAPLLGIDHIEAHIYSCYLAGEIAYPALALVVSGGHTLLVLIEGWGRYKLLGQTQDDAVGEAYDKVASMLGLPFPGGPAIEARAKKCLCGSSAHAPCAKVRFPRPLSGSRDFNFSFSGLKTAVLYALRKRGAEQLSDGEIDGIACEFQRAVIEVLVKKTLSAARRMGARCILLAGGVAQNESLRKGLRDGAEEFGLKLLCAPKKYCTDNGVMVAALAFRKYADGARSDWSLDIAPGFRLC